MGLHRDIVLLRNLLLELVVHGTSLLMASHAEANNVIRALSLNVLLIHNWDDLTMAFNIHDILVNAAHFHRSHIS